MEILTREDLKPIEAVLEKQTAILDRLADKKPMRIVRGDEIMERIGIVNRQTFYKRLPELVDAGAFKNGGWCILESDLEAYMHFLKTQNNITL